MVHRLALIIGGVGAGAVLALAVVLSGIPAVLGVATSPPAAEAGVEQLVGDSATVPTDEGVADVVTVVDTVYIDPDGSQGSTDGRSGRGPEPTASPEPRATPFADHGNDNRGHRDGDHDRDADHEHGARDRDDRDHDDRDHDDRGHDDRGHDDDD